MKPFKLPLYFRCNVFGENKRNATMGKCSIISCAVSLFWVKIETFSWPPFVTWLWEGYLIADISLQSFMIE